MRTSPEGDRPLPRVALALAFLDAPNAWLLLIDHPWNSSDSQKFHAHSWR